MLKRDWFGETFRSRIPILLLVYGIQLLYFPINMYLQDKGGFKADIASIDGNMPLLPIFVVVYYMGLASLPIWHAVAAWKFPRDLFQKYIVAFLTVMITGFLLWIIFPAYVEKDTIEGSGFFTDILKNLHDGDDQYGNHNAIPSSHVYYVTIAVLFYIQIFRKWIPALLTIAVINALSTMFTHQHYFLDVITGFMNTYFAYALATRILVPWIQQMESRHGIRRNISSPPLQTESD
jgi:membrane-associated phospholipid phosphatase